MLKISIGAELAWQFAAMEAAHKKSEFIEKEHIFNGILSLEKVFAVKEIIENIGANREQLKKEYFALREILKNFNLNMTDLRRAVRNKYPKGDYVPKENVIHRSKECKTYFARAKELGAGVVNSRSLLAAVLENSGKIINEILKEFDVDAGELRNKVLELPVSFKGGEKGELISLKKYSRDLVSEAEEGKLMPLEGRRDEMLQIVRILSRKTKNNPVLIGEAGVGKTAIVEGVAQRIAIGKSLKGKRIFELNMSSLVGGTKYRGEFEDRLNRIIKEAESNPEVILFLDEVHNLVGAGAGEGNLDAANILKPALSRGKISCIGATTIAEYRKYIEKDTALERRFQPVEIDEPTPEETIKILVKLKDKFEEHHNVKITDEAIRKAVELSVRYVTDRLLPDKAIDIIDDACASVSVAELTMVQGADGASEVKVGTVDEETVASVVSRMTGIPVSRLTKEEADRLLKMEESLKEKVKGQDEAVKVISKKVRMSKAGMRDKNRPLGVFLFIGPTGVGKTLMAKVIAEVLFGSEREMIRIDMSEYQEKHTVSKLIGAPPGYIGYDEEGQLTGKLRSKPYCVVLIDEIEKSHPEVLDIFLQLFDEGRLTDSKGRTVNGKNAIFIMTSNLPPEKELRLGFKHGSSSNETEQTISAISKRFRPEFVNRIDKIVVFKHLSRKGIKEIVGKELDIFKKQMERDLKLSVSFEEGALDLIAEKGYSEVNGAREIHRTVEVMIKEPISEEILKLKNKGKKIEGKKISINTEKDKIKIVWKDKSKKKRKKRKGEKPIPTVAPEEDDEEQS